jgi:hypothetical protein
VLKDFAHKIALNCLAFLLAHFAAIVCLLGGIALGALWF